MLIITGIESHDVQESEHYTTQIAHMGTDWAGGKLTAPTLETFRETIVARKYKDQKGRTVMLAVTGEIGEMLGLQYEAWEAMDRQLRDQGRELMLARLTFQDKQRALDSSRRAYLTLKDELQTERDRLHHRIYRRIKFFIRG